MAAGKHDFNNWEQGSSIDEPMTWQDENNNPINLTNFTARMQIRKTVESQDIVLSLTTENGKIQLGGTAGTVRLVVPSSDTVNLSGYYVYDIEIVGVSTVQRFLEGSCYFSPNVTR